MSYCNSNNYAINNSQYNMNMQQVYCNLTQQANTNLSKVITSGVSLARAFAQPEIKEGFCQTCGGRNPVMVERFENCPTDFLNSEYNKKYQKVYCNMANGKN